MSSCSTFQIVFSLNICSDPWTYVKKSSLTGLQKKSIKCFGLHSFEIKYSFNALKLLLSTVIVNCSMPWVQVIPRASSSKILRFLWDRSLLNSSFENSQNSFFSQNSYKEYIYKRTFRFYDDGLNINRKNITRCLYSIMHNGLFLNKSLVSISYMFRSIYIKYYWRKWMYVYKRSVRLYAVS